MSARRLQKLEAIIEHLERQLDPRPAHYLLHVDASNGTEDAARFEREYGIAPDAVPPGSLVVERRHFTVSDSEQVPRRHDEVVRELA